jgi:hypothetical protein
LTPNVEPYHRFTLQGPLCASSGLVFVGNVRLDDRIITEHAKAQIERAGGEPWIANAVRVTVEYVES